MKTGPIAGACLCTLLLVPAGAAPAQPDTRPLVGGHGEDVTAFVAQHDRNGDARLSWEEFVAFRRARFAQTDRNGDGHVDQGEYVDEFLARARRQLQQDRAAALAQARTRFSALDLDRDGSVSPAEFAMAGDRTWDSGQQALARLDRAGAVSAEQDGRAARRDRLGMPDSHTAEGFLALYDGDRDGQVSRAEFDRARQAQFARGDANGDGRLSGQEYQDEYAGRLDARMAAIPTGDDRQVRVRFATLDRDGNGWMTFAEYQALGRRTFEMADRNHDGVVDAADVALPAPPRPRRAAARN